MATSSRRRAPAGVPAGATYVFSTLATDMKYIQYKPAAKGDDGTNLDRVPEIAASVVIKGGAGIANKNLITPQGVVTVVTDEDVAVLLQSPVFKQHQKNGFVTLSENKADPEQFAPDMAIDEGSAPLSPSNFDKDAGDPIPSTGELPEERG